MKTIKINKRALQGFRNNMGVKINSIIAFVFISFSGLAQNGNWTLQKAVNHALENNISVQQTTLDGKIAEENVVSARANFLPNLNASASHRFNFGSFIGQDGNRISLDTRGNSFGLNTGVTIFNGFQNINQYKQAKLGLEANKLQLDILKNNISLNIVNVYLSILLNKEALTLAKEQLKISQKSLGQVQELVDAGARAKADLLVAKSQLASDNERLVNAQNSVDLALLSLSQLLQVSDEDFDIQKMNIDLTNVVLAYKNSNEILSYAIKNRPEIKSAELNIENAKLSYEISKGAYYPTLSFGAGASTSYQHAQGEDDVRIVPDPTSATGFVLVPNGFNKQFNDNLGYNLGFSLNVPIFNGFRTDANVSRSKISKERIELALEQEKQTLTANVKQAYADARASLIQYEASQASLKSQEEAYKNEQDKYDLGVSTSFQLEQVRNRLINSQSSFLNAKYNYVFKTKVLDFYLDKPIIQ